MADAKTVSRVGLTNYKVKCKKPGRYLIACQAFYILGCNLSVVVLIVKQAHRNRKVIMRLIDAVANVVVTVENRNPIECVATIRQYFFLVQELAADDSAV